MSDQANVSGNTQKETKVASPESSNPSEGSSGFTLKPSVLKAPNLSLGSNAFKLQQPKLVVDAPCQQCTENGSDQSYLESETKEKPAEENQVVSVDSKVSSEKPKFSFGEKFTAKMEAPINVELKQQEEIAFVFGSNLSDKVVNAAPAKASASVHEKEEKEEEDEEQFEVHSPERVEEPPSLEESAALQLAKEVKPQLKEVETVTGEENERNIFKVNAKVRVFDKDTQSWQDKGCGLLHLNDLPSDCLDKTPQSRLIMRATGTMRVVLNIMLWPEMLVEKANPKNIKISAVDPNDGIKIYLITVTPSDGDLIYQSVKIRKERMSLVGGQDKVGPAKRHLDEEAEERVSPKRFKVYEEESSQEE